MKLRLLFLPVLFVLTMCSAGGPDQALKNIETAEKALYGDKDDFKFDESKARDAINAYVSFADEYSDNKETPDILFKAADLYRAVKEYDKALAIYKKVETEYADYEKAPHSVFLQGFVYENELFQLEKAKERYETFLEKYPNHDLADDVKFSLKNLGKSPEEIIKQFEQNQVAEETDSATS